MGIVDLIKNLRTKHEERFTWQLEPDGLAFKLDANALSHMAQLAQKNILFGTQLACLKQLEEQGLTERLPNAWIINTAAFWECSDELTALFNLPPVFTGFISADIEGVTTKSSFRVNPIISLEGESLRHYQLKGPFIQFSQQSIYQLTKAQWRALDAVNGHNALPATEKNEFNNNLLVSELMQAKAMGLEMELSHFDDFEVTHPEKVGVTLNKQADGSIILTPNYGVDIDANSFAKRIHKIQGDEETVLRIGKKFILLDEERIKATHEILNNYKIPKEQVERFLETPTAYLDASLIDLDNGFSLRVAGAAPLVHGYFGDTEKSGIEWFAQILADNLPKKLNEVIEGEENVQAVEQAVQQAIDLGASFATLDDEIVDVSEPKQVLAELSEIKAQIQEGTYRSAYERKLDDQTTTEDDDLQKPEQAVIDIVSNDDDENFVAALEQIDEQSIKQQTIDYKALKRTPYEHQDYGIRWLLAHATKGIQQSQGSGALLADDMGLGKTFMVLVAIAEYFKRVDADAQKPVLIVAPLSLLENWQAEIDETFHESPFSDVVILQSGADLKRFKQKGAKQETLQVLNDEGFNGIRYSLNVGKDYGLDRLDMPKRLVLTTYQTLRDYQFSLCSIAWGVVAFDEAQNIKNPNALQTRAAKGLNADFRLLATGTPVENSLKDIWCLFDMALPGLLGSWKAFHSDYIAPINQAAKAGFEAEFEQKQRTGEILRQHIGQFMLRRIKEDNLKGLPTKSIWLGVNEPSIGAYEPSCESLLAGKQLSAYNAVVNEVLAADDNKQAFVLPALQKLRELSIHHDLQQLMQFETPKDLIVGARQSAKMDSVIAILDKIKAKGEKVIIFATNKMVQRTLAVVLQVHYQISIEIINGETKAVSKKADQKTRKGIIDQFQAEAGFGIIIMSPVAAGVGLTVTGANHVIHLERHWNPAKEAQATDRVYRIGQQRPVNIYIPIIHHPEMTSFDVLLNRLLTKKVDLSQSVMATDVVQKEALMDVFGQVTH